MSKNALRIELFMIFVLPPILVVSGMLPKMAIMPILWTVSLYAYLLLRRTRINLWAIDFDLEALYIVLLRFFLIATLIALFVIFYEPDAFLALVRHKPGLWITVIVLYPILSAYIQEVLFRSFFFYRYKKLFKGRAMLFILTNALLFAYAHIVFGNWIAVLFTFMGGMLFAHTYLKTRSTLLTAIEHSLYGNTLYTLGLGYYFYHGSAL